MRATLLVAIVVLVVAGCGGKKDTEHMAFANSLNAICREDNAKLRRLVEPTTAAEIPPYVNGAIAIIKGEARKLSRLKAPSDQRQNLAAALAVLGQQVDAARQMAVAGSSGDTAAINTINKTINSLHGKGQALAKKMGAKDCSAR
jgi:hypothetical protein